jgi:hypothetical protein
MNSKDILTKVRAIPKRTTAGVAVGLFGLFTLLFPKAINEHWQNNIMYIIEALGATGIADWVWRNKKEALAYIKKLFTKKKK